MVLKTRTVTTHCPVCNYEHMLVERFELTTVEEMQMVETGEKRSQGFLKSIVENGEHSIQESYADVNVLKPTMVTAVTSKYDVLTSEQQGKSFGHILNGCQYCPECGTVLVSNICAKTVEEMFSNDEIKAAGFGDLPIARNQEVFNNRRPGLDL